MNEAQVNGPQADGMAMNEAETQLDEDEAGSGGDDANSGMVRGGGIVGEPGLVRRPSSQGVINGGPVVVHYPCTDKVVDEQVASWS